MGQNDLKTGEAGRIPVEWGPGIKVGPRELTFDALRDANVDRQHFAYPDSAEWTPTDWGCALAGETGEACNLVKKARQGEKVSYEDIARELADVVVYADLLAACLDIDLGEAVRANFNEVSERVKCEVRL